MIRKITVYEFRPRTSTIRDSLPDQFLDVGDLARWLMAWIGVTAVDALFPKPGPAPNQIVHGALKLLDSVFEVVLCGHMRSDEIGIGSGTLRKLGQHLSAGYGFATK